jgi:hypothetical protein
MPLQNQERYSVQNVIFRRISSPEAEQDSLFCSGCNRGVQEFGTEAIPGHILVPQKTNLSTLSSIKKQDQAEFVLQNPRFLNIHGRNFLPSVLLYRKT